MYTFFSTSSLNLDLELEERWYPGNFLTVSFLEELWNTKDSLDAEMPRENRKRGKKNKKAEKEFNEDRKPEAASLPESSGEPSWIIPSYKQEEEINPEAPFGYVDVDVKAYFRTVDVQIRNWQESQEEDAGLDEDIDPNERMSTVK